MNESKKPRINPYLAVLVGVLAVSFSSLFVKLSTAEPVMIATYRLFFTFLLLAPFTLLKRRHDLAALSKREALLAAASGLFLALHFVTWFTSLKYTSVASSVVLVTTQPIFVVIGSLYFFGEQVPRKALFGGTLAIAGSVIIGAADFQVGLRALFGDVLALAAAILVSGYLLIGRSLRARVNLSAYTFVTYGTSAGVLLITSSIMKLNFTHYAPKDWLMFLALAVVCTIAGHTVFNWALRYIQASVVAVSILGEPVGAIIWAIIFLNEAPTLRQIVGGSIILIGLFIFTRATGSGTEKRD